MKHHFRDYTGSNHDSIDATEWTSASYNRHPCDDLEPQDDAATPYREAAIGHLRVLWAMDEFLSTTKDARLAWIGVALALRLTSVRGLTIANIAQQLGVTAASVKYAAAEFARLADLDDGGGVQSIRPSATSNGSRTESGS